MRPHRQHTARRTVAAVAVLLATVAALSACRTSPSAAAYVGDDVITTTELDEAVQNGLDNGAIFDLYQDRLPEYRQIVLQELIAAEVYDAAAERYDAAVSEADISARLNEILAQSGDPDAFYQQQAAEGRTEADVREQIRRFVLGEEIAAAAGLDTGSSEAALRDIYDATRSQYAQFDVGLVTVADQPTADAVLAQLTADPTSYAEVATANPNANTFPEPMTATAEQLANIVEDPSTLVAGQGLTVAVLPTGEITVVFIVGITYPTFEDIRPTLEQQADQEVQTALDSELQSVRDSLHITVNPRFGSFDESGTLIPDDRGVVNVVDGEAPAATEPALN